jgi:hypothetical protein
MKSHLIAKVFIIMTCWIPASCTKESDPPEKGLIFYYPFNGNLKDASGNKNNGIDHTSGTYVPGVRGKALNFNGKSDYIELSKTINSENGLSFSFWIKSRGAAGTENYGVIIGKYNMSASYKCFLVYSFGAYETRSDNRLSAAFYAKGFSSDYYDRKLSPSRCWQQ